MKLKFIFTLIITFVLVQSIHAQSFTISNNNTEVIYLNTGISDMNLVINWRSRSGIHNDSWEVQGSIDGHTYNTIGMVLGADPKNPDVYSFKQKIKKIRPGYIYFRVMQIENAPENEIARTIK